MIWHLSNGYQLTSVKWMLYGGQMVAVKQLSKGYEMTLVKRMSDSSCHVLIFFNGIDLKVTHA